MRLLAFLGLANFAIGVAFVEVPKEIELGKNYTVKYKPADVNIQELWLEFRERSNGDPGGGHFRSEVLYGQLSTSCTPDEPLTSKCFPWTNVDYYGGNGTYTWMITSLHVNWTSTYPYGLVLICDECGTATFSVDIPYKGKEVGGVAPNSTHTQSIASTPTTNVPSTSSPQTSDAPSPLGSNTNTPTQAITNSGEGTLSAGTRAGIAVGTTVGVLLVAAFAFLFARKRYRAARSETLPDSYGNKQELDGMGVKMVDPLELNGEDERHELENVQKPVEVVGSGGRHEMRHVQEPVEMWAGDWRRSRGSSRSYSPSIRN